MKEKGLQRLPIINPDAFAMFDYPNLTGTPERNLLLAVLERAILDYLGNRPKEVEAAKEWIFCNANTSGRDIFSFDWICEQLDLNSVEILSAISGMPRRGENRTAPWYWKNSCEKQACFKKAS